MGNENDADDAEDADNDGQWVVDVGWVFGVDEFWAVGL